MSWLEKLYETYEAGVHLDFPEDKKLMPISHTLQNAHINIVIDEHGNFKRATVLEKPALSCRQQKARLVEVVVRRHTPWQIKFNM